MKKLSGSKFRDTRRSSLLLFVLVIMGVALAVNVTITSRRAYDSALDNLRLNSSLVAEVLVESLSGLVYNFQIEETGELLHELIENEQFLRAEIIDVDGRSIAIAGSLPRGEIDSFDLAEPIVTRSGEKLADLTLTVSHAAIASSVRDAVFKDSVVGAIQIFGILLIVYLGTSRMVSAVSQAHDKMRQQAQHDELTGLLNRRGVRSRVVGIIARRGATRLGLIHLDLDRFKVVNDTLGHATGDQVLEIVADRLRGALRPEDLLARVGGDEFLVISDTSENESRIDDVARCLVDTLNKPLPEHIPKINIGASAGTHTFLCGTPKDFDRAIGDADLALYEAKNTGRSRHVAYSESLRQKFTETEQLLFEMEEAMVRDEFLSWFQPQINVTSGTIEGVEALLRWDHPKRGMLPPGVFMVLAEDAGLLDRIDTRAFAKAVDALAEFRANGLPDFSLSFNLTASRLRDPTLVDTLVADVARAGLSVADISLEILETATFDARHEIEARTIRELARAGFEIELDDFGTSHSSIANLLDFPINRLKIDRHFISDIDTIESKQKIVNAMLNMASGLNISTLAEGVETENESEMLRNMGCDVMQGYYFAKPMSSETVSEWCRGFAQSGIEKFISDQQQTGHADQNAPQLKLKA